MNTWPDPDLVDNWITVLWLGVNAGSIYYMQYSYGFCVILPWRIFCHRTTSIKITNRFTLQVLIVQFGSAAFSTTQLTVEQWMWCIFLGAGELLWGQVSLTVVSTGHVVCTLNVHCRVSDIFFLRIPLHCIVQGHSVEQSRSFQICLLWIRFYRLRKFHWSLPTIFVISHRQPKIRHKFTFTRCRIRYVIIKL